MAKELNSVHDVNYGGCCVVAAAVAEKLQYVVPTRVRVASFLGAGDRNVSTAANNVGDIGNGWEWHQNGIFFSHVIVEFDHLGRTYHMDSTGVKQAKNVDPSFGYELYDGHLPIHAAKALADEPSNWNNRFDRDHIPFIKNIVREHMQAG